MIQRIVCRSVVHNLVVTDSKPYCEGSIELDAAIMEKADIADGEQVVVTNITRGGRAETYAVRVERDSGGVETSGSLSHFAKVGDEICVMAFALVEDPEKVSRIELDFRGKRNLITKTKAILE